MAFTKITGPGIHTLSNIMSHNVKSSGIITAVNGNLTGWLAVGSTASFGGDVTVGGTLTYDDVTNIDSVGLITARAGIHVGAGGSIIHAVSSNNGKVGINETSPDAPLHITGGLPHIRLENSGTSANANDIFGQIDFKHNDSSDPGVTAAIKCVAEDTNGNSFLAFYNGDGGNADERLRIESDGNILAKTGTQFKGFHLVKADGGTVAQLVGHGSDNDEGGVNLWDGGTKKVQILSNGSSYLNGGSIGIGEETPDSKLDILHSSSTNAATENLIHLRTDPGAGYASRGLFIKIGRDLNYDNSGAYYDIVGSAGNSGFHAFQVQGDDKLRITKDGKVGIGTTTPSAILEITKNAYNTPDNEDFFRIKLQNRGGITNDVGIGQIATGNLAFNTTAGANFTFHNGTNGQVFRIEASGAAGGGVGISTAGGTISPDHNALLIRAKSSVGTNKGHIMLTGDSATVDEGPQIVFSESGSGSNYAGGSIGFHRKGSNSIGDLVFGTRQVSGDANTTTEERLRIDSSGRVLIGTNSGTQGQVTIKNGNDFSTASVSTQTDNIFLISDATSGDGVYGASIGFSRVQYADRRAAVIATVQEGSDEDHVGLAFFTHQSTDAAQPVVEALRITSGGAVQISGADDQDNFEINVSSSQFAVHTDDSDGEISLRAQDGAGGTNSKYMTFFTQATGQAATEKLRITTDGKVGINSTSPSNTLVVREPTDNNSSLQLFRESTGGDISSVIWATNQGNQASINYRGGGGSVGMQFYTGGTGSSNLRAIINSSGLVGIGTNNPTSHSTTTALHIHDEYNSQGYPRFRLTNAASGSDSASGYEMILNGNDKDAVHRQRENANIDFMTNNENRMRIHKDGGTGFDGGVSIQSQNQYYGVDLYVNDFCRIGSFYIGFVPGSLNNNTGIVLLHRMGQGQGFHFSGQLTTNSYTGTGTRIMDITSTYNDNSAPYAALASGVQYKSGNVSAVNIKVAIGTIDSAVTESGSDEDWLVFEKNGGGTGTCNLNAFIQTNAHSHGGIREISETHFTRDQSLADFNN